MMKKRFNPGLMVILLLAAPSLTMGCQPADTVRFTLNVHTDAAFDESSGVDDIVQRTVAVLRQRLDRSDVAAFSVEREGAQRIIVDTYGARDVESLSRLLLQTSRRFPSG